MVESIHRQGFACLRGGRKMEKGGFRNRAAAPRKLGHTKLAAHPSFYNQRKLAGGVSRMLHANQNGHDRNRSDRLGDLLSTSSPEAVQRGRMAAREAQPNPACTWKSAALAPGRGGPLARGRPNGQWPSRATSIERGRARARQENPGRLDTSSEPGTFPGRRTAPLLFFLPFLLFISAK
jgi:hypothetical protein